MNHDDRLIVALDFPTMEQAKAVVLELGDNVSHWYGALLCCGK